MQGENIVHAIIFWWFRSDFVYISPNLILSHRCPAHIFNIIPINTHMRPQHSHACWHVVRRASIIYFMICCCTSTAITYILLCPKHFTQWAIRYKSLCAHVYLDIVKICVFFRVFFLLSVLFSVSDLFFYRSAIVINISFLSHLGFDIGPFALSINVWLGIPEQMDNGEFYRRYASIVVFTIEECGGSNIFVLCL